jgi:putative transposase
MPDHVHMLLSKPPKYAVSQVVGYIKAKSAIHLARVYGERKRGVGRIREYIKNQESEDQKLEQLNLWR